MILSDLSQLFSLLILFFHLLLRLSLFVSFPFLSSLLFLIRIFSSFLLFSLLFLPFFSPSPSPSPSPSRAALAAPAAHWSNTQRSPP